jgi:hypothetical protein
MFKSLSVINKENGVIIKHKSEKKKSDYLASSLINISIAAFVISFVPQHLITILITFSLLIAAIVFKLSIRDIKNNISIKIQRETIYVEHISNYNKKGTMHIFPTKDIRRLYVARDRKENLIRGKKTSRVYCCEIWAEKNNGEKVRILGDKEGFFTESQKTAQFIMQKMQTVLQLATYTPPKQAIQYIGTNIQEPSKAKLPVPKQRKINKETEISKMTIKDFEVGVLFDYKNETWEVIAQTQYDWQRGNTDTLYQVQNSQNATILLLVCQDMAVYSTWLEERLPYHELAKNNLNKAHQGLPLEFEFRDKLFLKESLSSGHEFVGTNQGQSIKEWKYISENSTETLRILEHEDEDIFVFSGKKVESYEFSNILLS